MLELKVEGMSCQHCVKTVTRAVQEQDANASVEVDLDSGTVRIASSLAPRQLADAIRAAGYPVAG